MKIGVKGKVINTETTKKGNGIAELLTAPDPKTGAQEVLKVWTPKPLTIGQEVTGHLRGEVELWFLEA